MQKRVSSLLTIVVWLCALAAQAQVTTGTISGTVTDSSNAVLPGVKLVIENEDTGISREVRTDSAGRYLAPMLGLGNYRVTASLDGFQTEVRSGIALTVGREAEVNLQLSVGAVTESVQVTGEAPLVQTAEATVAYQVGERTIAELPLNSRDMTQLILLQPGVVQAANGAAGAANVGFSKRISIAGMRGESNAYLLDGGYIVDFQDHIPAGPSNALFGDETIREFQVLTNSFGASYGRVLGGVFNAVSKSGTNEWHGDAYEFLRNSALDARNFFDTGNAPAPTRIPPYRRNQFGGTFGGPIKKDKTFFFAGYEALRQVQTNSTTTTVPDVNARLGILSSTQTVQVSPIIAPYLQLFPLPTNPVRELGGGTAVYIFANNQRISDNFGQIRVDHQISASDAFFARFTASSSEKNGPAEYPSFSSTSAMNTRLFTISETHIISPRALNTFRFHFNRVTPLGAESYNGAIPPGVVTLPGQAPPGISPGSGITAEGTNIAPGGYYTSTRFTNQDDVNLTLSGHALQFGGMLERFQLNFANPNRPNGTWTWPSLTSFLTNGLQNQYRGTPTQVGSYIRGNRSLFMGFYIQDNWRITNKLTLNLGLRWEPYTVPTEVNGLIANLRSITDPKTTLGGPYWLNHSWKDFGPRFGFAWSPLASGRTSVRGGFGLFDVPIDSSMYFVQETRVPPLYPEFQSPVTVNRFPDVLAQIASITTQGTAYALPYSNFRTAHALQYNLSVQQQFGTSNVVNLSYTGSRGIDLSSFGNWNQPQAVFDGISLAIPANATVYNPNFANINYFSNNSDSWYNAFVFSFQRRFSKGFQAQVSYTFSKGLSTTDSNQSANDVNTGGSGYLESPRNMAYSKSLSSYDVRNVLNANFSYQIPSLLNSSSVTSRVLSGWQLTSILGVQNGQPFSVRISVPTNLSALGLQSRAPNLVLGSSHIVQGGPNQYFNPLAYSYPTGALELGNVGRNTLIGPGLAHLDAGLIKDTHLAEQLHLQFRAEFFNLLNRANFSNPASSVFNGTGGRTGNAGLITSTTTSARQIQFALKLVF